MVEVRAVAKHVRVPPRKARLVAALIRNQNAETALKRIQFVKNKAGRLVARVLKSAIANAENNAKLEPSALVVKQALVDEGITWRGRRMRARGAVNVIHRRTSHITVVVEEAQGADAQA
ncbi:MAG: 50S ribosomal protein L22 [Verrucomicrobia bacterium]|nr:50S ribosomal protein L22 [Verrucomicrobiota bacterium]